MSAVTDRPPLLRRIVSGGQTGADRAALDAALDAGVACGGWCPADRRAEDGPIPRRYPLRETPSRAYGQRTRWNVRDSDGTLVLATGPHEGGTALTVAEARALGRPLLSVEPGAQSALETAVAWLRRHRIGTLNVAGPRESEGPGGYAEAYRFIAALMAEVSPSRGERT